MASQSVNQGSIGTRAIRLPSGRLRWQWLYLVLCLLLPTTAVASHQDLHDGQPKRSTEAVRGWAIINLVRFSTWPTSAFKNVHAPIKVCSKPRMVALPIKAGALGSAVRKIHGRRVVMRQIDNYEHLEGCHVLFLNDEDSRALPSILRSIHDRPIAIVSDTVGFAQNGGAFELIRNENTAFFKINATALQRTGILLTQALMRLGLSRSHGAMQ